MRRILPAAFLLGYAVFLAAYFAPVPAGSDSSGYFNSARLLAEGRMSTPLRTLPGFEPSTPWVYTPHGFTPEGRQPGLTPTYPSGLPLQYVLAVKAAGWKWGPTLVAVLASVMGVVLTFFILRELEVRESLAFAGAALLAVSPLFLQASFTPMSDVPATAWLALAVLGGLRCQVSARWAAVAGLAFSVAVLIRPSTAVLAPAFALLLGGWLPIGWAAFGALPGVSWQLANGVIMYGSMLKTGYGEIGASFDWANVWPSWCNYAFTFPRVLPLAFGLGLLPWWPWRTRGRVGVALTVMTAILLGFYSFYNITHEVWWYLRFVLPVVPVLIALVLGSLEGFATRLGRPLKAAWLVPTVVIVLSVFPELWWARKQHVLLMKSFQQPYADAGQWAQANLPAGTAVAAMHLSGTLYFYTDNPIVRWDLVSAEDVVAMRGVVSGSGRSIYAMVHPADDAGQFRERLPWRWDKVAEVGGVVVYRSAGQER